LVSFIKSVPSRYRQHFHGLVETCQALECDEGCNHALEMAPPSE
jgi:hypothetical protein